MKFPKLRFSRLSSDDKGAETILVVDTAPTGGSFSLPEPAPISLTEQLATGWTADITEGSKRLVVRGSASAPSHDEALEEALDAAQEFLDLLVMKGKPALVLADTESGYVVWWSDSGGTTLRITTITDIRFSSSATAIVRDAQGRVKPHPPAPPVTWHPSFRYFRLAQTTSDLFDAFRNTYLALEAVLSDVVPQRLKASGRIAEGEGEWLRRALKAVDADVPLGRYAPAGSTDPVGDVFNDVYAGTRTAVFHAKSGRPTLLPHDLGERPQVIETLERLSRFFLDLTGHYLNVRRPSSAMTYAGFDVLTNHQGGVVLSDDDAPPRKSDTTINPSGGHEVTLPTRKDGGLSRPGLTFWFGEAAAADVPGDLLVRRAGLIAHGGPLVAVERLDEPVSCDRLACLQIAFGLRLVNVQQPRFRFQT